ncbi:MAG: hypothetical protein ACTSVZ_03185 [Promethearchaeota archaeon]
MKSRKMTFLFILLCFNSIFISLGNYHGSELDSDTTSRFEPNPQVSDFISWTNVWGGELIEIGSDIAMDTTGLVVVGRTWSYGYGEEDCAILKFDLDGNLLWNVVYGTEGLDLLTGVWIDDEGYIYAVGWVYENTTETVNHLLLKLNQNGDLLWNRTWGEERGAVLYNIDGDNENQIFYVVGTSRLDEDENDFYIGKYNFDGQLLWNTTIDLPVDNFAFDVYIQDSNQIYVCGEQDDNTILIKMNGIGEFLWNASWGGSSYDNILAVQVDQSGNVYVSGRSYSFGPGINAAYLEKYDTNGNQLWLEYWGGTGQDYAQDLLITDSGDIIVIVRTSSYGMGDFDSGILKYDASGTLLNEHYWGGPLDDRGRSICGTGSNEIYTCGSANYGSGDRDIFVQKCDLTNLVNGSSTGINVTYTGAGDLYHHLEGAGTTTDDEPTDDDNWFWSFIDGFNGTVLTVAVIIGVVSILWNVNYRRK